MMNIAQGFAAAVAVSFLTVAAAADSSHPTNYCFAPCKSKLHGYLKMKEVTLDDPKMRFTAYILELDKPISVPESGPYEAADNVDRIQLQFPANSKVLPSIGCINVAGKLVGPETATDIEFLVMQIDSFGRCK